jgi:hypothetical protein
MEAQRRRSGRRLPGRSRRPMACQAGPHTHRARGRLGIPSLYSPGFGAAAAEHSFAKAFNRATGYSTRLRSSPATAIGFVPVMWAVGRCPQTAFGDAPADYSRQGSRPLNCGVQRHRAAAADEILLTPPVSTSLRSRSAARAPRRTTAPGRGRRNLAGARSHRATSR